MLRSKCCCRRSRTIPIARQIAEALEAAHDHGIIHRDSKPANIKLRPDGDVMILPLDGDEAAGWTAGTPAVFINTRFSETEPMFSPDGRWLAYDSNESGESEVYGGRNRMFDLHPDGKRIAMNSVEQAVGDYQDTVVWVFNVLDELRRIAPVAKP